MRRLSLPLLNRAAELGPFAGCLRLAEPFVSLDVRSRCAHNASQRRLLALYVERTQHCRWTRLHHHRSFSRGVRTSAAEGVEDDEGAASGGAPGSGGSDSSHESGRRTYYSVLEVSRRATKEEIKEAYLKLAKKWHPDRNIDNTEAEARFKEIQEAHTTLSDTWKRALYDQDLQFGAFGTGATQDLDKEAWTQHWDRETPEEREARKERYKRYAAGERNDLPPDPFPVRWSPVIFFVIAGTIYYVCIRAPDWFDLQSDATYCDPAFNDRAVPLVRAFHDPVLQRWERLPDGVDAPSPADLYAYYKKHRPDLMEYIDLRLLPKFSLTTLMVPRTEAVKALMRPGLTTQ